MNRLFAVLLLAPLLAVPVPGAAQGAAPAASGTAAAFGPERAREQLASTAAELKAIPDGAAEDSPEGRRRSALRRRVALLEEYLALQGEAASFAATRAELEPRGKEAGVALDALGAEPEVQAPSEVTRESYEALEKELTEQRTLVTNLRSAAAEADKRLDEALPRIGAELATRLDEAEKRTALIAQQIAGAASEDERTTLAVRLENARLDAQVAREAKAVREDEARFLQELAPVTGAELDLADKRLNRMEARFELASAVREVELARERAAADAALAEKEREAETATDPAKRFVAEREARLARSGKNRGDAEGALVSLNAEVTEQERRLATEKSELAALRELIGRDGGYGIVEERIRVTLAQAKLRRQALERAMRGGLGDTMTGHRTRRFQIDDALFGLRERFESERDAVTDGMPDAERRAFVTRTNGLLDDLRGALREEKATLTELIAVGQQIQTLHLQRMEVLGNLERFIRTQAFWLRDGRPLGPAAFSPLGAELERLLDWAGTAVVGLGESGRGKRVGAATLAVYAVGLLLVVPAVLMWLRQRLRAATRRVNNRVLAEGNTPGLLMLVMLTSISSAAMIPIYFVIAARSIGAAGLPATLSPVVVTLLEHLGYGLFAWFLARSFFARRSIAEVQFNMPHEAANDFYVGVRWLLVAYVAGFVPWLVLSRPPFEFVALARIAWTVLLAAGAVGAIRLVSSRSAFVQHRLALIGPGFFATHWQTIAKVLSALVVGVLLLDFAGFRYAAQSIATSFGLTLVTLVALPTIYGVAVASIRRVAERLRPTDPGGFGDGEAPEAGDAGVATTADRMVDFLRLVAIIAGVVLVAGYWGVDTRAFDTLEELHVYGVRGVGDEPEFVTAADLARALLFLIGTVWVLRTLPGIYEFAIFPRLGLDAGVKYALLTMSRYAVFTAGILLSLAELHLDLGRLGWLMAAIGVGLGFGLQEIVSNFVSGVILLVERPVSPGDIVTVGGITGTVQRINIRATTIMNFDRQEVVLPNRSLITKEVTNWTRGDTMNRLVVPIGVAYGTDPETIVALLLRLADEDPSTLKEPKPQAFFMAHGESSLDFELRVFVPSPSELNLVRNRMNMAINRELAELGIEIPFPQRDVHIRSGLDALGRGASQAPAAG